MAGTEGPQEGKIKAPEAETVAPAPADTPELKTPSAEQVEARAKSAAAKKAAEAAAHEEGAGAEAELSEQLYAGEGAERPDDKSSGKQIEQEKIKSVIEIDRDLYRLWKSDPETFNEKAEKYIQEHSQEWLYHISIPEKITEEEKKAYIEKYSTDGKLDSEKIGKAKWENMSIKERATFLCIIRNEDIDAAVKKGKITEDESKYYKKLLPFLQEKLKPLFVTERNGNDETGNQAEEEKKPDEDKADQKKDDEEKKADEEENEEEKFSTAQIEKILEKYKTEFANFIETRKKDPEKALQELKAETEDDREIVDFILDGKATDEEKSALLKKLNNAILKPKEIRERVESGSLNLREEMVALDSITNEKLEEWKEKNEISEDEEQIIRDRLEATSEEKSEVQEAVRTGGLIGVIEFLIKKIGELIDYIKGQAEMFAEKFNPKFHKSPFGKNKKFELARGYEDGQNGVDIKTEPNQNVMWLGDSKAKVLDKTDDSVTVDYGENKVVYKGIKPEVEKGAEIGPGGVLGKTETNVMNFQMWDKEGKKQKNPESYLRDFVKSPEEAVEPPEMAISAPPLALATGTKLEITETFAQNKNGIKIKAAPGAAVTLISSGIVRKSEGDTIEILCKDNTVITYQGLKNDDSRIKPEEGKIVTAGTTLGRQNDAGTLILSISEKGALIDPATKLTSYI